MDRPADRSTDRPIALVVGAASRDVTTTDPRGWRLGGAVTYASLALRRLGIDVWTLVGVDRAASTATELATLEAAGAVVTRVALDAGPVFENLERPDGRRQRCLSAADPVELTDLPRAWTSGFDALVLAPVAGEIDDSWALLGGPGPATADGPGDSPLVALVWQGLLRRLEAGTDVERVAPAPSALLQLARLVVVSRDDLVEGLEIGGLVGLLGPSTTLVVTAAETGGQVIEARATRDGSRGVRGSTYPAIPSDGAVDATGAGDVFLAAMVGAMLRPELGDPVLLAAAAASLTVEGPGLAGVPDLETIRRRMTRPPSRASRRPSATSSRTSGRPNQA
jgi:sugar/nucleoside kinase (ribokinase family)